MKLLPPEGISLTGSDEDYGRGHLSPSSLDTQLACPERFRWNYIERLQPAVAAPALEMGKAFAMALEKNDPEVGGLCLLGRHRRLLDIHGADPWVVVPNRAVAEVQAAIVVGASGAYLQRYGQQNEKREVTFRQRLRNPVTHRPSQTYDILCRVDGLSVDGTELIEDKFTGQIPRLHADHLARLDRQLLINCYTTWRCTKRAPATARFRWTLKPQIKQKQNESHDAFLERIVQDYTDRPDHYLHESEVTPTFLDFLRLEQELWEWADQRRTLIARAVYPRNTRSCQDYGGCRFLALCAQEPGARHGFVDREDVDDENEKESKDAIA